MAGTLEVTIVVVMNTKTDPICEVCREHPVFKDSLCAECAEIEGETLRREYNELRAEVERFKSVDSVNYRSRALLAEEALLVRVREVERLRAEVETWKATAERLQFENS